MKDDGFLVLAICQLAVIALLLLADYIGKRKGKGCPHSNTHTVTYFVMSDARKFQRKHPEFQLDSSGVIVTYEVALTSCNKCNEILERHVRNVTQHNANVLCNLSREQLTEYQLCDDCLYDRQYTG